MVYRRILCFPCSPNQTTFFTNIAPGSKFEIRADGLAYLPYHAVKLVEFGLYNDGGCFIVIECSLDLLNIYLNPYFVAPIGTHVHN